MAYDNDDCHNGPVQNVCGSQDTFNRAVYCALKYNAKQKVKDLGNTVYVYLVLYFLFLVWALMLALNVPSGPSRVLHVLFALLFGPIYVLAYYLGMMPGSQQFEGGYM